MFRRLFISMAGLAIALGLAAPAEAFVPVQRTQFNTVKYAGGSYNQQMINFIQVEQAINSTPKGEIIHISIFSFYSDRVANALVRAKKRGVRIHFLTHAGAANTGQAKRVKAALGTNTKASSWFKACAGSCARSGTKGTQHSKLFTSSKVTHGKSSTKNVVMVFSGNLGEFAGSNQWNQFQTVVDAKLYSGVTKYIDTLKNDRDYFDYPTITSGKYQLGFFPRKRLQQEPVYTTLKGLSPKYGCKVRVAMFVWGSTKLEIATRMAYLKKRGCDVKAIVTKGHVSKKVVAALKGAKVPVYNSEVGGAYMHAKVTTVQGRVNGTRRNYTFTGSANFSEPGTSINGETLFRINSAAELKLQYAWFDKVASSKGVKRL